MDECLTQRWDNAMKIKGLIDEDIVNYKKISMILEFPYCSFKCDKEFGKPVCQNSALAEAEKIDVDILSLISRYINNPITRSIVCQGLEPIDSWEDLLLFITEFRKRSNDDFVIYTGYREDEIKDKIEILKQFPNIVIKFGRFIPNQKPHHDDILGVDLASDNQYAIKIS